MSDEEKTGGDETSILGQLLADETAESTEQKVTPEVAELQRALAYEHQRNASLEGRMDASIRPLNATVRELQAQLSQAQLNPAKKEAAEVSTVTVQDLLAELTPADRELMGEKQLAIMAKLVEKPTQAMVDRVKAELQASFDAKFEAQEAKLRQVEGQAAGQTGRELWDRVDQLSPGARDHNDVDDAKWVEFLNQKDPISGRLRKDLGNAAVDAYDVARLALLHDEFKKLSGEDKVELETKPNRELRPEGSRAEPGIASGGKPNIKSSEVDQFYKDLANGKYEGKPALADKMEALITAAIQDGRVL